jgi:MFS family permease
LRTGDHAGTLSGIGNTIANIPGVIGPIVAAAVLKRFMSWAANVYIIALLYIVAAGLFGALCKVETILPPQKCSEEDGNGKKIKNQKHI